MQAVNRLSEQTINVESQAREAYRRYRSSYDIAARYRSQVLPLRKTIADETMLRYGAMQIDVFSLLTEAQRRIAANIAAIEAQREFRLAETNLDAAMLGGGIANSETTARPMSNPADAAGNE
jgi:outer membrane protein TolC